MRKPLILVSVILLLASSGLAIGAAPSIINAGTIERGEVAQISFYVYATQQQNAFQIRPRFDGAMSSNIFEGSFFDPEEYSQERFKSWLRFTKDSYLVNPNNVTTVILADGSGVNAHGKVTFYIEVPEDAEPGYHAGTIKLNPDISSNREGTGTILVSEPVIDFFFRVPGPAQRQVVVEDIRAFRSGQDEVRIDTMLHNVGTVTTTVAKGFLDILGPKDALLDFNPERIAPGEYETVTTYWRHDAMEGGDYEVEGNISWMTGAITRTSSFSIPDTVEIVPGDTAPGESTQDPQRQQEEFPLWLVVMTLVVLGVLMYSLDVAPIWILATLGFVGISIFIWVSSVSNAFIIIPLIIFAATIYMV